MSVYPPLARALHWASLALLIVILLAVWLPEDADSETAYAWRIMLHRSAGLLLFGITVVRLAARFLLGAPPLPPELPRLQRLAARANVAALYALLLAQPGLGLLHSQAAGDTVRFLGLFTIPALVGRDRGLARTTLEWHETSAILLLVLVGMHALAALYRHHVRRDGVLTAMLPGLRHNPPG
ncbi:MAG: cytochrome [Rubritepida sp.]|nr:cytochrome [Rubritepida sp.]